VAAAAITTTQAHDVAIAPLLAGMGSGLRDDFVASYADLHARAYRVAFRLLGDRHEAEDIAQEACIRACMRWRKLRDGGYEQPWVVHVSVNLARDRWRRLQRTRDHGPDTRSATTASVEERMDLHRALDGLPERQREVVLLRYVADLSEQEVARRLKCAPGTVKTHAARGLASLRAALGQGAED
jgi:RNA polymerase sigma-70 factor (sigma-E family)